MNKEDYAIKKSQNHMLVASIIRCEAVNSVCYFTFKLFITSGN